MKNHSVVLRSIVATIALSGCDPEVQDGQGPESLALEAEQAAVHRHEVNEFAAAQAPVASSLDGTWTFRHGASGQLVLNSDSTYTTTCSAVAGFDQDQCPEATGTWSGNAVGVSLYGDNGHDITFGGSGGVGDFDLIVGSERYFAHLEAVRGASYKCRWYLDAAWRYGMGPVAESCTGGYCLRGSDDVISGWSAYVSETSLNYFVSGIASGCENSL